MAHCLIIDDSRVIRAVMRRLFEDLHFSIAEAQDGLAGLRACRERMPDLVLLDWSMTGMTGVEFVRALRAQPGGGRPVILAALTEVDVNAIAQGVAAGIDDYLVKPFDREILSAKLAGLGTHRAGSRAAAGA